MTRLTTAGLRPDGSSETELPAVAWGIATGSVNAVAVTYDPAVTGLTDGLIVGFRALGANTSGTVTFNPSALGAKNIVKGGGQALLPGDIPGVDADVLVRYNEPDDRWECLNPYRDSSAPAVSWAEAGGTVDAITATYTPAILTLVDGMLLGVRASGANTSTAPTFSPNGLTARTITREGGQALQAGDIFGAGHELLLRYRSSATRWELLNPALPIYPIILRTLSADDTGGQNVNTAQPWFPSAGGISLAAGTYEFEGVLIVTRSAGTTSHTTSFLMGGTATSAWRARLDASTGDSAFGAAAQNALIVSHDAGAVVFKAASTSATESFSVAVRGVINVTAAGTIIPQFQYSATPGGAPTIKSQSYFKLQRVGAANLVNQGGWA